MVIHYVLPLERKGRTQDTSLASQQDRAIGVREKVWSNTIALRKLSCLSCPKWAVQEKCGAIIQISGHEHVASVLHGKTILRRH